MPLAISQAAAYINQRASRITVAEYLNDFYRSDSSQANLLNRDAGDLRRDNSVSNSIFITWKMLFDQIRKERPSAARLLSLMSFFDRQGIPEFLLRKDSDDEDDSTYIRRIIMSELDNGNPYQDTVNMNRNLRNNRNQEFEDDISTLVSYSLITTAAVGNMFEMHRLVQISIIRWLESYGDMGARKESIS